MSASGDWDWLTSFSSESGCSTGPEVNDIAPSGEGGVFVVGQMEEDMVVDGHTLTCNSWGNCNFVIKIDADGAVDWSAKVQGPGPMNAGSIPNLYLSSLSSDPGSGITLDLVRTEYYADSGSDVIISLATSTGSTGSFITGSNAHETSTHHYVSFSESGNYMGHYRIQSQSQMIRMGGDLYVREHTSLAEGDYAYLRAVPQDCGYGCVHNISRIDYDSTFTASLARIDGGVYIWLELSGQASDPPELTYVCVWASPSQWCDGPAIPADHYILNITIDGGFADGTDTMGYDLLSDHPYRQEEALFIENGTRLHSLSGLPDFELLGAVDRGVPQLQQ